MGTIILSQNKFLRNERVEFTNLIVIQNLYLKNFLEYASSDAKAFYTETYTNMTIEVIEKLRAKILYSKMNNDFNIDPKYWFKILTLKINLLKKIDDYLSHEIINEINIELENTYNSFLLYLFLNIIGTCIFFIIIILVTKLMKSEKILKAIADKYIISSSTDVTGKITEVSDAFCDISGYTKEELIGKSHNIIRHPDMPKNIFENMWNTIKNGKPWQGEVENLKKDGGIYWVYANIEPLFDKKGNIESYVAIRLDITDSMQLKEELKQNIQRDKTMLQQSKLAQMGEMISMIAHQWRQPLTAISSTSGAINLKSRLQILTDKEAIELSNNISNYSQHLSETINDFREFFKSNKEKKRNNI